MDRFAKFVNDELKRIAFFLQYASVIEEYFSNKAQKDLMSLPVKWDPNFVLINGAKPTETTKKDFLEEVKPGRHTAADIQIKGEIGDRTFILKRVYVDGDYNYFLDFEDGDSYGKNPKIRNMTKIRDILTKIEKGETHEESDPTEMYNALFKGKAKTSAFKEKIINKFFSDYSHLTWKLEPAIDRQKSNSPRLRIYATNGKSEEIKNLANMMMELDAIDDIQRSKPRLTPLLQREIPNYVGSYIQDAGFEADPKVKGVIKPKFDDEDESLTGNIGFTVWL